MVMTATLIRSIADPNQLEDAVGQNASASCILPDSAATTFGCDARRSSH